MNTPHEIPHEIAPVISERPADKPVSGIASLPMPEQARAKTASLGVPPDLSNLAIGAGLLLTAFLIFWMGLYLSNYVALRTLVASFGTCALVWVLWRLRIFHRPHGGLIAAGAVALFAAALPFIECGFQKLDRAAKAGLAGEPAKPASEVAEGLPVSAQQRIPPPPAPAIAPSEDDTIHDLAAPAPNSSLGKIILVTQDAKVVINGKKFLIHEGSKFPFKKLEDGMVTFQAGEQEVTIDASMVSFTGQSKETPEEIARLAGEELRRRYPILAVKNSPEREMLDARIAELKVEWPELFKNPRWPLDLGEQLAAQEGWTRADAPQDAAAPLPPELPLDAPQTPAELPPVPPDIPQEAPK